MDGTVRCAECATTAGPGQKYCGRCGAPLPLPEQSWSRPRRSSANSWIIGCAIGSVVLIAALLFAGMFAMALPNFIQIKDKAKEAEVKQNLHSIQLAIERYAVDNNGLYPPYLIGGAAEYALNVDAEPDGDRWYQGVTRVADRTLLSDPLLRDEYLTGYPDNPFTRNGGAIQRMLQDIVSVADGGGDPLRSGADGNKYGTRFGAACDRMGNVFADPRYRRWDPATRHAGLSGPQPTWADIEYRFWDMWATDTPKPFLPGQFWYKSAGELDAAMAKKSDSQPVIPAQTTAYMLGAIGGLRTVGSDVVGDELPIIFDSATLWPWTRSSHETRGGDPFGGRDSDGLRFGNPNGISDGVVIVLASGSGGYVGDR